MEQTITLSTLEKLEKSCLELLDSTQSLGKDENTIAKELLKSLRKIVIANEFSNRQIICVSGLQGSGKTTLMKNFYALPEDIFNISLGRGERIPQLITEKKNCVNPELCVMELVKENGHYHRNYRQNITAEEFVEMSRGTESGNSVMYLELIVPFTHTHNESVSFMLLPGYEKKNDYWRQLVDFSVKCSDAAIFVFNESNFSSSENEVILRQIKENFAEHLIYVISHSDCSADDNAEVKETCMRVMEIDQEDRVICSGAYEDEEKNTAWIKALKHAIEENCRTFQEANHFCSRYIHEEIAEHIQPLIWDIKDLINQDSGDEISTDLTVSSWLETFDRRVAGIREEYREALNSKLASAMMKSGESIEKSFSSKESFWRTGGRIIFGTSPRDYIEARKILKNALFTDESYSELRAAKDLKESLGDLSSRLNEKNETKQILLARPSNVLSLADAEHSITWQPNAQNILKNIMILLNPNPDGHEPLHSQPGEERIIVPNTLTAIAEFGACYYCTTSDPAVSHIPAPELAETNLSKEGLLGEATATRNFALGMLGLFGIDVVSDGNLDLIPEIANSIGVSIPAVAVGASVMIALGTGQAIIKDMNRMMRDDMIACQTAADSAYDHIKNDCLEHFDDFMGNIRHRIETNLIALEGRNKKAFYKYNAKCAISKIEDIVREILCVTQEGAYGIGAAYC